MEFGLTDDQRALVAAAREFSATRLRDLLGLQIGDGTAQIMKLVIARQKAKR